MKNILKFRLGLGLLVTELDENNDDLSLVEAEEDHNDHLPPSPLCCRQLSVCLPFLSHTHASSPSPSPSSVLVATSPGVVRAQQLALFHAQSAVDALMELPPSDAQLALIRLTEVVLTRSS